MPPVKKVPTNNNKKATELVISLLVGLFILSAIIVGLLDYIESFGRGTPESLWARVVDYFLQHVWPIWKPTAGFISLLAFFGIIYNSWHLRAINIEEQKIYNPPVGSTVGDEEKIVERKNEKWKKVIGYMNSSNVSDWRLAIIEADVMLEETLHAGGYAGESIGEMLKSADRNDFLTLDEAWEAHKTRNVIAHSGGDFQLTEREMKRAIALFEKVFKEFQMI